VIDRASGTSAVTQYRVSARDDDDNDDDDNDDDNDDDAETRAKLRYLMMMMMFNDAKITTICAFVVRMMFFH